MLEMPTKPGIEKTRLAPTGAGYLRYCGAINELCVPCFLRKPSPTVVPNQKPVASTLWGNVLILEICCLVGSIAFVP